MKILHLNLNSEYFHEIKSGKKKNEYRLYNEYWIKRLVNRNYTHIHIKLGYPLKTDTSRIIVRIWHGCFVTNVRHKVFGNKLVKVFAIIVN